MRVPNIVLFKTSQNQVECFAVTPNYYVELKAISWAAHSGATRFQRKYPRSEVSSSAVESRPHHSDHSNSYPTPNLQQEHGERRKRHAVKGRKSDSKGLDM